MKSKLFALAVILLWGTTGYLAHGYCLGDFTKNFPENYHERFCIPWGYAFGPIALPVAYIQGAPDHAYRQTGYTKKQRWEAFHILYPSLSRAEFERTD